MRWQQFPQQLTTTFFMDELEKELKNLEIEKLKLEIAEIKKTKIISKTLE